MIVPVFSLFLHNIGVAAVLPMLELSDVVLLATPVALASLWLLARAGYARSKRPPEPAATTTNPMRSLARSRKGKTHWIIVDGSNVMHWQDGTPRVEPLRDVLRELHARGYTSGIVFDANAGYLITGRYQHDHAFGTLLGLPDERIMVVPKGTPADPMILTSARDLNARVVTNDRYTDWVGEFPEIRRPGYLVRGGYHDGKLWLDVEDARTDPREPEPA